MLGETDPAKSLPGTIRGDFCIDVGRWVCAHCFTLCFSDFFFIFFFLPYFGSPVSWLSMQEHHPRQRLCGKCQAGDCPVVQGRRAGRLHQLCLHLALLSHSGSCSSLHTGCRPVKHLPQIFLFFFFFFSPHLYPRGVNWCKVHVMSSHSCYTPLPRHHHTVLELDSFLSPIPLETFLSTQVYS